MPRIGDRVPAEVTHVVPRWKEKDALGYERTYAGYCTVSCEWGSYNMMNGSIQSVPHPEQVVGRKGELMWTMAGGYCGPVWRPLTSS